MNAPPDRPTEPPPATPRDPAAAYEKERAREAREIADLGKAALDFARSLTPEDTLQNMPLPGVLFLAMVGTPGERAEIDPPALLALYALRRTLDGWNEDRSNGSNDGKRFARISFADLDLLARRLDATIEIVRRGGAGEDELSDPAADMLANARAAKAGEGTERRMYYAHYDTAAAAHEAYCALRGRALLADVRLPDARIVAFEAVLTPEVKRIVSETGSTHYHAGPVVREGGAP